MPALLQDISTLRSGYAFRGSIKDDPMGSVRVVQLGDIDWERRRIDWDALPRVPFFSAASGHFLHTGDVLFVTRGRALKAIVVDTIERAVAAATFFVVRVPSDVLPEYLAWYINSAPAQMHLAGCSRGSNLQTVTKACLGSLPVPVPPLHVQERIARADRLAFEEAQLLVALGEKRRTLADHVLLHAATHP